jgi:hypothetical protein
VNYSHLLNPRLASASFRKDRRLRLNICNQTCRGLSRGLAYWISVAPLTLSRSSLLQAKHLVPHLARLLECEAEYWRNLHQLSPVLWKTLEYPAARLLALSLFFAPVPYPRPSPAQVAATPTPGARDFAPQLLGRALTSCVRTRARAATRPAAAAAAAAAVAGRSPAAVRPAAANDAYPPATATGQPAGFSRLSLPGRPGGQDAVHEITSAAIVERAAQRSDLVRLASDMMTSREAAVAKMIHPQPRHHTLQ